MDLTRHRICFFFFCACLLSDFVCPTNLALAVGNENSIEQALEEIRTDQLEFEAELLRSELTQQSPDKPPPPKRDPETGALNITGETPRNRSVRRFVGEVLRLQKTLLDARKAQDQMMNRENERISGSSRVKVALSLVGANGKELLPVKISVRVGGRLQRKIQFTSQAGLPEPKNRVDIFEGVLKRGQHEMSINALLTEKSAALGGTGRLFESFREKILIDQKISVDVPERDSLEKGALLFSIEEGPEGPLLVPSRS